MVYTFAVLKLTQHVLSLSTLWRCVEIQHNVSFLTHPFLECTFLLSPASIGWGLHTTARTQQHKKIQAEGRVSAETGTTTHF